MRISDWSSDVCSSDLGKGARPRRAASRAARRARAARRGADRNRRRLIGQRQDMGSDTMNMTKARWTRQSSRAVLILAGIGAFAAPLAAQEAPAEAAAAAPAGEEAIVVTGSRIARETYDTPAPVIGVSSEEIGRAHV